MTIRAHRCVSLRRKFWFIVGEYHWYTPTYENLLPVAPRSCNLSSYQMIFMRFPHHSSDDNKETCCKNSTGEIPTNQQLRRFSSDLLLNQFQSASIFKNWAFFSWTLDASGKKTKPTSEGSFTMITIVTGDSAFWITCFQRRLTI